MPSTQNHPAADAINVNLIKWIRKHKKGAYYKTLMDAESNKLIMWTDTNENIKHYIWQNSKLII